MKGTERIFHIEKTNNFTVVDNKYLRDKRLGWKEKGLLTFLLQLPPDWKANPKEVSTHASDSEGATANGFRTLAHFGYAEYRKERDPQTGRYLSGWYFFEETKKPEVSAPPKTAKKKKGIDPRLEPTLFEFQEAEEKTPHLEKLGVEIPLLDLPHPEKPGVDSPIVENRPLLNTKDQELTNQVLLNQKLKTKTTRENEPTPHPQKPGLEKTKSKPQNSYPESWLESFQKIYKQNHGSYMGEPVSELKALEWLYKTSLGNWSIIESKVNLLTTLRKEDVKFWNNQPVSPETISKYWSRLFEREKKDQIFKKKKVNEENEKKEKPKEEKKEKQFKLKITNSDPYENFLAWGKTKLPKSIQEYFETNRNPAKFEGTKKILYDKYFSQISRHLQKASNAEIPKIGNQIEIKMGEKIA